MLYNVEKLFERKLQWKLIARGVSESQLRQILRKERDKTNVFIHSFDDNGDAVESMPAGVWLFENPEPEEVK